MNKINKILIIILIIAIIIVTSAFVYLTYIADHTYEDERISITVPAQTTFNINATYTDYWTGVEYNSNDTNNISIRILRFNTQNMSFLGVPIDFFSIAKTSIQGDLTKNQNYTEVSITENYTVYYNKEKDKYVALFFDENKKTITLISVDGDSDLINMLASSFILKSFNTNGLELIKVNDTNSSNVSTDNISNSNVVKNNSEIDNETEDYEEGHVGMGGDEYYDYDDYDYNEEPLPPDSGSSSGSDNGGYYYY